MLVVMIVVMNMFDNVRVLLFILSPSDAHSNEVKRAK